jgi:hypothetical protein
MEIDKEKGKEMQRMVLLKEVPFQIASKAP